MATANDGTTVEKSTHTVFTSVEFSASTNDAQLEVRGYHYPDGDDNLEAKISFNSMDVFVGLSPQQAREFRDDLDAALAEVDDE